MTAWDDHPGVLSPVGRSLDTLLEEGPRRQPLDGYDAAYRDFVDYIIRCTHRIWEQKDVGLCRTHYSPDCKIHTLAGPVEGVEAVVQNTIATLAATSDRQLIGEDVIWSEDPGGRLYSSHRIMSRSTHFGDDALLGPATMRSNGVQTIADCVCIANRIVEEWLVRDNLRAVWQVGGDPWAVARAQAELDRAGDQTRHGWRSDAIAAARTGTSTIIDAAHPASGPAAMLTAAMHDDLYGAASQALSAAAEIRWPSNRHGFGRGYWIGCMQQLRAMLHEATFTIDHHAARPLPDGDVAVALRWSLVGTHRGAGPWGPPTGRDLLIFAVSHYRLRANMIIDDVTVFDELAVLRQIAGGLGA